MKTLSEIMDALGGYLAGDQMLLTQIKVLGVTMPADYQGSVADYLAEQQGLIPSKVKVDSIIKDSPSFPSEVPTAHVSLQGLREQLRQELDVKKDYFAKPVFRIYVPGRTETQLVTNSFCGSLDWR
jgi:hypothetical protein